MANNWKYASLGQRDRLKMIRSGDADVYNSEKERNNELRKLQTELGVSTAEVDQWDALIDYTYANANTSSSASDKEVKRSKSQSAAISAANQAFSKQMQLIKDEKNQNLEEAKDEAEKSYNYLVEWLANNGYSDEGKTSKEEKAALKESISKLLKQINEQYETQVNKAKDSIFGPFLK